MTPFDLANAKAIMISRHCGGRDITDQRVLAVLLSIPREQFVPGPLRQFAYDDRPLAIGHRQTISQPYMVALMTQTLALCPTDKVLEIGTGSGYQTAVLSELAALVYTVEIVEPLGVAAKARLGQLGINNIHYSVGDGYYGWRTEAPFDKIIVTTAAPGRIPPPLLDQLSEKGNIVAPVGRGDFQNLIVGHKQDGDITYQTITPVRFVPMTGAVERK